MLQHYVLIDQDRAAEVFDHMGDGWTGACRLEGLDASLDLPALGLSLPLSEIYDDVLPK